MGSVQGLNGSYLFMRTRYFLVNSKIYWEHQLEIDGSGRYIVDGQHFTESDLKERSQRWETGISFQKNKNHPTQGFDHNYPKSAIRNVLYYIYKTGSKTYILGDRKFTPERLEEFLNLLEQDSAITIYNSEDKLDTKAKEKKLSPDADTKLDTTLKEEVEPEGNELLQKIMVNLQAKMMAVKRYGEVSKEVKDLRILLAEKEADLRECERVVQLEAGQI